MWCWWHEGSGRCRANEVRKCRAGRLSLPAAVELGQGVGATYIGWWWAGPGLLVHRSTVFKTTMVCTIN